MVAHKVVLYQAFNTFDLYFNASAPTPASDGPKDVSEDDNTCKENLVMVSKTLQVILKFFSDLILLLGFFSLQSQSVLSS